MSNANVLILLIWSTLFGIAGSIDEWKYARWPFLAGMAMFSIWVLVALSKSGGI